MEIKKLSTCPCSTDDSSVIDYIRFPLAVFVVIHHSFGNGITSSYDNITQLGIYDRIRCIFSHVLVHIDNPAFFFISGYLFFLGFSKLSETTTWNWQTYGVKLKKRISTLVIPYLLWNIIPLMLFLLIKVANNFKQPLIIFDYIVDNFKLNIFWNYYSSITENAGLLSLTYTTFTPINGPLWFLRDLILMVLISPLIFYLITKTRGLIIALFAVLFIGNIWYPILSLSITAVFFYSLGAYFSVNKKSFLLTSLRIKGLLYVITLLVGLPCIYYDGFYTSNGEYFYPVFVIFLVFSFLNISKSFINKGFIPKLPEMKQYCFFIYACHIGLSLIFIVGTLFGKLIQDTHHNEWLLVMKYFMTIIIVLIICVILNNMTKIALPKIYKILTGNRS